MIEIKDLQKVIDQKTVIDIKELSVKVGEIAAVVGPVDSGKATLLKLLTGKFRPTIGTICLAEVDPYQDKKMFSQQVGVLFSEDNLYQHQTARANLQFYSRLHRLPKERCDQILALVGLSDHADERVDKLSSSLVRRLALGRAILHQPIVLLLVEPFAKCDDNSVALLSKLIQAQADQGAVVLLLADDDAHLGALCDTIHLLSHGRITQSYQPQEVQAAQTPFKIPVRLDGKVVLVNPGDILYADAADGRAFLQTREDRWPTQFTLSELEDRLERSGFFRAHRSYLVNLQHVKEVIPYTRNSFSLRLDDETNTEIPLSKSAAAELKELLGY